MWLSVCLLLVLPGLLSLLAFVAVKVLGSLIERVSRGRVSLRVRGVRVWPYTGEAISTICAVKVIQLQINREDVAEHARINLRIEKVVVGLFGQRGKFVDVRVEGLQANVEISSPELASNEINFVDHEQISAFIAKEVCKIFFGDGPRKQHSLEKETNSFGFNAHGTLLRVVIFLASQLGCSIKNSSLVIVAGCMRIKLQEVNVDCYLVQQSRRQFSVEFMLDKLCLDIEDVAHNYRAYNTDHLLKLKRVSISLSVSNALEQAASFQRFLIRDLSMIYEQVCIRASSELTLLLLPVVFKIVSLAKMHSNIVERDEDVQSNDLVPIINCDLLNLDVIFTVRRVMLGVSRFDDMHSDVEYASLSIQAHNISTLYSVVENVSLFKLSHFGDNINEFTVGIGNKPDHLPQNNKLIKFSGMNLKIHQSSLPIRSINVALELDTVDVDLDLTEASSSVHIFSGLCSKALCHIRKDYSAHAFQNLLSNHIENDSFNIFVSCNCIRSKIFDSHELIRLQANNMIMTNATDSPNDLNISVTSFVLKVPGLKKKSFYLSSLPNELADDMLSREDTVIELYSVDISILKIQESVKSMELKKTNVELSIILCNLFWRPIILEIAVPFIKFSYSLYKSIGQVVSKLQSEAALSSHSHVLDLSFNFQTCNVDFLTLYDETGTDPIFFRVSFFNSKVHVNERKSVSRKFTSWKLSLSDVSCFRRHEQFLHLNWITMSGSDRAEVNNDHTLKDESGHPKLFDFSADTLSGSWDPALQIELMHVIKANIGLTINLKHHIWKIFWPHYLNAENSPEIACTLCSILKHPFGEPQYIWKHNPVAIREFSEWYHSNRPVYLWEEFMLSSLSIKNLSIFFRICPGVEFKVYMGEFSSKLLPHEWKFSDVGMDLNGDGILGMDLIEIHRLGDRADDVRSNPRYCEELHLLNEFSDLNIDVHGVVLSIPEELDIRKISFEIDEHIRGLVQAFKDLPSIGFFSESRGGPGYTWPFFQTQGLVKINFHNIYAELIDNPMEAWLQNVKSLWTEESSRQESLLEFLRLKISRRRKHLNEDIENLHTISEKVSDINFRSYFSAYSAKQNNHGVRPNFGTRRLFGRVSTLKEGPLVYVQLERLSLLMCKNGDWGNFYDSTQILKSLHSLDESNETSGFMCSSLSDGTSALSEIKESESKLQVENFLFLDAFYIDVSLNGIEVQLRRFPSPLAKISQLSMSGLSILSKRHSILSTLETHRVTLYDALGQSSIEQEFTRSIVPFKLFYFLNSQCNDIFINFDVEFVYTLQDIIDRILNSIVPGLVSPEETEPLAIWDFLRYIFHGSLDISLNQLYFSVADSSTSDSISSKNFLDISSDTIRVHFHHSFLRANLNNLKIRESLLHSGILAELPEISLNLWLNWKNNKSDAYNHDLHPSPNQLETPMDPNADLYQYFRSEELDILLSVHFSQLIVNLDSKGLVALYKIFETLLRIPHYPIPSRANRREDYSFYESARKFTGLLTAILIQEISFDRFSLFFWDKPRNIEQANQAFVIDLYDSFFATDIRKENSNIIFYPDTIESRSIRANRILFPLSPNGAYSNFFHQVSCISVGNIKMHFKAIELNILRNFSVSQFDSLRSQLNLERGIKSGNIVVLQTYENQRLYFQKGWTDNLQSNDRPQWSNADGNLFLPQDHESFELPDGWEWLGDWEIDFKLRNTSEVDDDGWEYARDFHLRYFSRRTWFSKVRRRRWIRLRQIKGSVKGNIFDRSANSRTLTFSPRNSNLEKAQDLIFISKLSEFSLSQRPDGTAGLINVRSHVAIFETIRRKLAIQNRKRKSTRSKLRNRSPSRNSEMNVTGKSDLMERFQIKTHGFTRFAHDADSELIRNKADSIKNLDRIESLPHITDENDSVYSVSESRSFSGSSDTNKGFKLLLNISEIKVVLSLDRRDLIASIVYQAYNEFMLALPFNSRVSFLHSWVTESGGPLQFANTNSSSGTSSIRRASFIDSVSSSPSKSFYRNRSSSQTFSSFSEDISRQSHFNSQREHSVNLISSEEEDESFPIPHRRIGRALSLNDIEQDHLQEQLVRGEQQEQEIVNGELLHEVENLIRIEIFDSQISIESLEEAKGRVLLYLGNLSSDIQVHWSIMDNLISHFQRVKLDAGAQIEGLRVLVAPSDIDVSRSESIWLSMKELDKTNLLKPVVHPVTASCILSHSLLNSDSVSVDYLSSDSATLTSDEAKTQVEIHLSEIYMTLLPENLFLMVNVVESIVENPLPFQSEIDEELSTVIYKGQLEVDPLRKARELLKQRYRILWQMNHLNWLLVCAQEEENQPEVQALIRVKTDLEISFQNIMDDLNGCFSVCEMRSKWDQEVIESDIENLDSFDPKSRSSMHGLISITATLNRSIIEMKKAHTLTTFLSIEANGLVCSIKLGEFGMRGARMPSFVEINLELTSWMITNNLAQDSWCKMLWPHISSDLSDNRALVNFYFLKRTIGGITVVPHLELNIGHLDVKLTLDLITHLTDFFSRKQFLVKGDKVPSNDLIYFQRDSHQRRTNRSNERSVFDSVWNILKKFTEASEYATLDQETAISMMKYRAKRYVNFQFVRIGKLRATVGYKGGGNLNNIEDFEGMKINLKSRVYQNKCWTVYKLGKRLKRDYSRAALSQLGESLSAFFKFKFGISSPNTSLPEEATTYHEEDVDYSEGKASQPHTGSLLTVPTVGFGKKKIAQRSRSRSLVSSSASLSEEKSGNFDSDLKSSKEEESRIKLLFGKGFFTRRQKKSKVQKMQELKEESSSSLANPVPEDEASSAVELDDNLLKLLQ